MSSGCWYLHELEEKTVISLTFVFQPESSCRHADVREKVEVELVGGAVEESRNRGALGRGSIEELGNAFSSIDRPSRNA